LAFAGSVFRPFWVTVKVCPAAVIVPFLTAVPVFAATLYETVLDPVPAAPLFTVIQAWVLEVDAVQVQSGPVAVTVIVPVPPGA
jgi:hypothetical protein